MRIFIAIELPDPLTAALAEAQRELRGGDAEIRWVKPGNIHLTLKFLGETPQDRLDEISGKLEPVCRGHHPFDLVFKGAGVFPSPGAPRVLWVGAWDNRRLLDLQSDIEDAAASAGFPAEARKYVPHLTLGRFKTQRGKHSVMERLELMKERGFGVAAVTSVSLMRSELRPGGAVYSRLAGFPLAV